MTGTIDMVHRAPVIRMRPPWRRPWVTVVVALLVATGVTAVVAQTVWPGRGRASCSVTLQPLAAEQVSRLQLFHRWLVRNHALGYVGEVGWPGTGGDADQWNSLANAWYTVADNDNLWVTTWTAGVGWPATYPMAVYRLSSNPSQPATAGSQAEVVAAHADPGSALRGVNDPTGAFGTIHTASGRFSDLEPGRYGRDYYYPTLSDYKYLARQGVRTVRLAFMWERIEPVPGGPLNARELHRLRQSVRDASLAGVSVILDLHNSGGFWHTAARADYPTRYALGSRFLPVRAFAELWSRLATAFRNSEGVTAYDLMNEPGDLAPTAQAGARIWARASQQAVDSIRATGDGRLIAVEAYGPSGPEQFADLQPRAWIHDPRGSIRYEMHQYFDSDGSGHYRMTLPEDSRQALSAEKAGNFRNIPTSLTCIPV